MFVLEALLLTFMTTPLVTALYPPDKRVRASAVGANYGNVTDRNEEAARRAREQDGGVRTRFTFVLDKLEHLPGMMALAQLIQPSSPVTTGVPEGSDNGRPSSIVKQPEARSPMFIDALRLIELSDRVSAVMKSSASDTLLHTDPLLAIFGMFAQLHDLRTSNSLSIVPFDDLAYTVAEQARMNDSDMIMLPWLPPAAPPLDPVLPHDMLKTAHGSNPFDALFRTSAGGHADKSASVIHSHFVRGVFSQASTDVALFVDQSAPNTQTGSSQHLFLPFFGGPDDRLALELVVQLCENPKVTATAVRVTRMDVEPSITPMTSAHIGTDKFAPEQANLLTVASVCVSSF